MKVLVISNIYPSRKAPYYGSFVKEFVRQIKADRRVNRVDCALLRGWHSGVMVKLWLYMKYYLSIFYHLVFFDYDLVYIHLITHSTLPVWIVSKFKRLNLVFNIHGEDLLVKTSLSNCLLRFAIPLLYKSKNVVVPSFYFQSVVMEKLPRLDADKIIVSPSGGVSRRFFGAPRTYSGKTCFKVGYVSRIDRGKGWDVLLEAVKQIGEQASVEVDIVGGGYEVEQLKAKMLNSGLKNVNYVGPIAHDDLPMFYASLDLFVFPTLLEESLGLVGIEAMAAGVPVVASRIGGIQDYLCDGRNGFFFKPGDARDLAVMIREFLLLPAGGKEQMSRMAIETAWRYRAQNVSDELFNKILRQ